MFVLFQYLIPSVWSRVIRCLGCDLSLGCLPDLYYPNRTHKTYQLQDFCYIILIIKNNTCCCNKGECALYKCKPTKREIIIVVDKNNQSFNVSCQKVLCYQEKNCTIMVDMYCRLFLQITHVKKSTLTRFERARH